MWDFQRNDDKLGDFIVNSHSIGVRDPKLAQSNQHSTDNIFTSSQKEPTLLANPCLRVTCMLAWLHKSEYSKEAPPPVETWLSSSSFPFCTTTVKSVATDKV